MSAALIVSPSTSPNMFVVDAQLGRAEFDCSVSCLQTDSGSVLCLSLATQTVPVLKVHRAVWMVVASQ